MTDTAFFIPPEKAARYAKALPKDPDTGRPQSVTPVLTEPLKFECGGGCLVLDGRATTCASRSTLLNKGAYGETRILGRKTAEYMLTNQLGPEVKNLMANTDATRLDYGFGLGLSVRTEAGARPHDRLGRRLQLAGRERHQLVGRSEGGTRRGVHGALAGADPLALPPGDQRAGLSGDRGLEIEP